jgi:hypothetical protein
LDYSHPYENGDPPAHGETVDLAILDVNLDGEKIYPIADALAARGVAREQYADFDSCIIK